ncbi:MAG TPA: SDR family oxidoreductase [Candidatus Binataceae bacterium]|jgi:3-oxoacyl-[acyl-carrier protein] reductase
MELGLKDRVALVTGSSRGIGRATAELLAREGARVAVTYHTLRERGETVAAGIRERGGDAFAIQLDISSDRSIRDAVAAAVARWGKIDILINNAIHGGERAVVQSLFEDVPDDQWRSLLRGNFEGAHVAIGAVLPHMRRQRWGRIVNVSSVVAADGFPGGATYGAAKAALHGLTRTLAKELAPEGILTNVVMPGLTLTEAVRRSMPEAVEQAAKVLPIRHVPSSEEVASVIVFVASAANTVINGEVIRANGGGIA